MSWEGIEGHDAVVEQFRRALERGRLASTFLFAGPEGIGKRTFALKLAQTLLCQKNPAAAMTPCGACEACVQVSAGTHPDLLQISKPADKSVIPIDLLIGPPERRMQEGFCHDISLRPFFGGRKVAVIDDADLFNVEGANALLKTLEEPPPDSVIILIGTSVEKQLPTIRSRSQVVSFRPLEAKTVARLLLQQEVVEDLAAAEKLAQYSEGSLGRARSLADPELWQFRAEFLRQLAKSPLESPEIARQVLAFIDAAGREAPARRERARQLIAFAAELYRQVVRDLAGCQTTTDAELQAAVARLSPLLGDEEIAAQAVERCLEAIAHIDRNVHQATAIECWLDYLSRLVPVVRS